MQDKDKPKSITLTVVFEASAVNRDEKIGGNIPSIKKMTRYGNGNKAKTFSYISRESIRHHLFHTLHTLYPDRWKLTQTTEQNKVVQFDLKNTDIIDSAEMDAFGYMYTIGKERAFIRKAPVGITKAVALESWEGDMQFNANHDIAKRAKANPNPVNKEEHMSYFKVSFTIDMDKFSVDEWRIISHSFDSNKLILHLTEKGADISLQNVEKQEDGIYKINNHDIRIIDSTCYVSCELMSEKTKKSKESEEEVTNLQFKSEFVSTEEKPSEKKGKEKPGKKGKKVAFEVDDYSKDEEENLYRFSISKAHYDEEKKILQLSMAQQKAIEGVTQKNDRCYSCPNGEITMIEKTSAKFEVDPKLKKQRILDIMNAIKNGLLFHVSGENYGIIPKFIIAAALKLPVPLFHSFINLSGFQKEILINEYILKDKDSNNPLVYIDDHMNLTTEKGLSWDDFVSKLFN